MFKASDRCLGSGNGQCPAIAGNPNIKLAFRTPWIALRSKNALGGGDGIGGLGCLNLQHLRATFNATGLIKNLNDATHLIALTGKCADDDAAAIGTSGNRYYLALRGGLQGQQLLRKRYPQALCYLLQDPPATEPALRQALAQPWWSPARWKNPPRLYAPPEPVWQPPSVATVLATARPSTMRVETRDSEREECRFMPSDSCGWCWPDATGGGNRSNQGRAGLPRGGSVIEIPARET